jgi:ABC-type Fe3+ transport system substrate-binding protein
MAKNLFILAILALIVTLPFMLRQSRSESAWQRGDPVLVIVTPHNEAIRYEFERGFSKWHQAKFGQPVKIEWRSIGGTTEIMRFLASEYVSAAQSWWTRDLKKPWPENGAEIVVSGRFAAEKGSDAQRELVKLFRDTDDPERFSCRIDLFFGGGEFDHNEAFRQGMTVAPWKTGQEPKGILTQELIPEKISGEIWRTPTLFGNAISTFGICYNADRLRELGVTKPPATWDDLADPICFRQVGAVDPTKSGSVAKAFEMIIHQKMRQTVNAAGFDDATIAKYEKEIDAFKKPRGEIPPSVPGAYQEAVERGWLEGVRLVQRIGANSRYFTDSASKVAIDVSMGDAAIGISIDFYARYQAQTSRGPNGQERMVFFTPAGGSSVSCDPISLLRGAGGSAGTPESRRQTRDVAVRFIEFVLSEEGQRLWTYKPGTPGGPEKFYLRRLPIRRDFYPSTNPVMQKKHEEHAKHAADNLADPQIDPYKLAQQFTFYKRWTGDHFSVHRDLIRVMCMDAGDELREAWAAINRSGSAQALEQMQTMPVVRLKRRGGDYEEVKIDWRTAPEMSRRYDKLDYTREWTKAFRESYRKAAEVARAARP